MDTLIFMIIALAVFIDLLMGELPSKIHPVVWMGQSIYFLKQYLIKIKSKWSGFILTFVLTVFFALSTIIILYYTSFNYIIYILISGILLSTTFSIKMLIESSKDVATNLSLNSEKARQKVSYLVSRDTKNLEDSQLISATIESLTENITDSITSPILFAFIFGVPGAMFFRIVNTLDAMVGYKNEENALIGWFPAKLDDILNYIPARVTGLIIVIAAFILRMNWRNSFRIMMRDARNSPSPNSGFTMAAAAGALEIQLEKPNVYLIGDNKKNLNIETIHAAIKLTKMAVFLFLIISISFFALIYYLISIYLICSENNILFKIFY